ncbi:Macoilin [Geodia barretti]|nr:Macoilin [Geodia barretti]
MLFLYVEVSFRLEKLPGQLLNFSRPFAAHCIGYPVVTMSFLIKHQIMHVIRQRQQKKIAEENAVYFAILQKALPQEPSRTAENNDKDHKNGTEDSVVMMSSTTTVQSDREGRPKASPKTNHGGGGGKTSNRERMGSSSGGRHGKSGNSRTADRSNTCRSQTQPAGNEQSQQATAHGSGGTAAAANGDVLRPSSAGKVHVVGGKKQLAVKAVPRSNQPPQTPGAPAGPVANGTTPLDTVKDKMKVALDMLQNELRSERTLRQVAEASASKMELEVKKLKADLQASCLQEEETATRVDELQTKEKTQRMELHRFKTESENLQLKLLRLSSGKNHDQASIAVLEKKLKEEEGGRQRVERELREHLDHIQNLRSEEEVIQLKEMLTCKERELDSIRKELHMKRRQIDRLQQDMNVCHMSLQAAEKDRAQLQNSLSEESGMKMRLLKALSELTHRNRLYMEELQRKNQEVDHLRQRLAEIMAIVPTIPAPIHPPTASTSANNGGFQPTTMTPFATTTTSSVFTMPEGMSTYHPPQSPVAMSMSTAAASSAQQQFLTSPGNQQP